MMTLNLFHLDAELAVIEEHLVNADGEIDDELDQRFNDLLDAREDKHRAYVALIRRADATAEAYGAEAKRLADQANPHRRTADRLKRRLLESMIARGEEKVDTGIGVVAVRKASTRPVVLDVEPEALPEEWRVVTVSADKRAIAAALKAGDETLAGLAHLGDAAPFLSLR